MKEIRVDLDDKSYSILIGHDILKNIHSYIENISKSKKIMIITDDNLEHVYGDMLVNILKDKGYYVHLFSFEHGEESKTLDTCNKVYENLINNKFTRSDLIIAFGGGVVGDLAGFVASTYLRGIDFIQIPTSLLAQVDSSVGGKVAVDLPQGKNLVGSFYQPKLVIIDCDILKTLPDKFFKDGMGEVIKYALIRDNILFDKLLSFNSKEHLLENIDEIIYRCCDIKRHIVEVDQFDTGERMMLNFGHTIGHAIEKSCGYGKTTHGICVCIGMNLITEISEQMKLTKEGTTKKIQNILNKYELDSTIEIKNKDEILDIISIDKKNINNSLNVVLLSDIGSCFIHKTDINFFNSL